MLIELLSMGFDDILTTNYNYELEEAALGINELDKKQLQRIKGLIWNRMVQTVLWFSTKKQLWIFKKR